MKCWPPDLSLIYLHLDHVGLGLGLGSGSGSAWSRRHSNQSSHIVECWSLRACHVSTRTLWRQDLVGPFWRMPAVKSWGWHMPCFCKTWGSRTPHFWCSPSTCWSSGDYCFGDNLQLLYSVRLIQRRVVITRAHSAQSVVWSYHVCLMLSLFSAAWPVSLTDASSELSLSLAVEGVSSFPTDSPSNHTCILILWTCIHRQRHYWKWVRI